MTVFLYAGADESLLRDQTQALIAELVADGDRSLLVDEYEGEEYELREVVDAAQTLPFLTDFRVVVARGINRFKANELAPLLEYLEGPLETTHLVLASKSERAPKKIADAVKAAGGKVESAAPPRQARERVDWVMQQAAQHNVNLDRQAATHLLEQIKDDVGRLGGILGVLAATYGPDQRLGTAEIEPFIGAASGAPIWDLTDAIDGGKAHQAIGVLHRMMHGGERHPVQLLAGLTKHYLTLARLDGAGIRDQSTAAEVLGISAFPAKKALATYGRLGGEKVHRAVDLLSDAEMDVRGRSGLPAETVMEILVARLSRL